MANWTDKSITFNPYIQQLPVEQMSQIGMMKQGQYDQGIQRIQSQIDNVAGMDIIRDVDKQYLQTKLDTLGKNLKTVAAGDFSNFQLVNSVGEMVGNISKDENVLNAVASTRNYRRGVQDMRTFNKQGKGSPSNDWEFNTQAAEWLNGTNVGETFDASYNPYTNYKKNALEVIKSLTGDSTITDNAFTTDSKGNIVISDAIVRQKLAGISPEKIQQALMVGLTPGDWKQMEIDGRYNYSNVDGETFARMVNDDYKNQYDQYAQQKQVLINALDSTISLPEKDELNQKITSINNVLKNISEEYNSIAQTFAIGDAESAKARLNTTKFINGFSRAFSFTETSQTIENSPYAELQMEREKLNRDWKKFMLGYEQSDRHFLLNYAQKEKELSLKERELSGNNGGYGAFPSDVNQDDVPRVGRGTIIEQTESQRTEIVRSDDIIKQRFKGDDIWLEQQRQAWLKSPSGVDPMLQEHFQKTEESRRVVQANQRLVSDIDKQADKEYGIVYDKIPSDAPSISYTTSSGTTVFSPRDLVDFNDKYIKYTTVYGPSGTLLFDDVAAKKELSPKEYQLFEIRKKHYEGEKLTSSEKEIMKNVISLQRTVNRPYDDILKERNKFVEDEITKRVTSYQGQGYPIPLNTAIQKDSFKSNLLKISDIAKNQKDGMANSPGFDADVAASLATDPSLTANMTIVEGTEFQPKMYEVIISGESGETKFRLTPEQKNTMFADRFESSPEVSAFRPYQEQIRKMGGYSTGYEQGKTNVTNSFLSSIDFPRMTNYGISGNIVTNNGSSYSLRLNIFDPITGKLHEDIPYPKMLSESQAYAVMQGLSDIEIFELINQRAPNAEELKQLKSASNKPLK